MAGEVKQRMVEGAVQLLAQRGLKSTSFAEVLELTNTPRGSVYHHFPEGKDQLVGAAVDLAGAYLVELMDRKAGAPAEDIAKHFLQVWRGVLQRSNCESGCAVLAVTVATESAELVSRAAEVFRHWRKRLAALLVQGGVRREQAAALATLLIASAEGAVVLSRAERSTEAFDMVSRQLLDQVRRVAADA